MQSSRSTCILLILVAVILQSCSAPLKQRNNGVVIDPYSTETGLLMRGAPPPAERRVNFDNWRTAPYNRWGFLHVSRIVPSATIYRGTRPVDIMTRWTKNINLITFNDRDGKLMSVGQMIQNTYTDGFIVLKDGKIITEQYFNGMTPANRHIIWSCSQAVVGSLMGIFVQNGTVDLTATVDQYIPELRDSGFGDATLRQVLDMRVGLHYSEDYAADAPRNIRQLWRATGFGPPRSPDEYSIYDYLASIPKKGTHGLSFQYATANTEVLGWIIERVSGKPLVQVLSETIWSKMGVERDAYSIVNRLGSASPGGGFCLTLRDFARFGQTHLLNGRFNDRDVIPAFWIEDIRTAAGRPALRNSDVEGLFSQTGFRSQWWVTGSADGSYFAMGIYGQFLYINPESKVVIAKMSSYPEPENPEFTYISLRSFQAISHTLKGF
jgi:CubicO group peptidase (beta-lactamase class C family)